MNEQQIETINVIQEVLRGVVVSVLASNPDRAAAVSATLAAAAQHPGLSPIAQTMLADLAAGPAMIEAASKPVQ